MDSALRFVSASEQELDELAHGRSAGYAVDWPRVLRPRFRPREIGVLIRIPQGMQENFVQPTAIVVRPEDTRRLFGRYAQLRGDLSPLSAWCHFLTPERFEKFDSATRIPQYAGYEAAWTGLVVAEALLLAERSIGKLKIAACLATQTYTVARTLGLWNTVPVSEILAGFDAAQRLRKQETTVARLRTNLEPIWGVLASLSSDKVPSATKWSVLVEALRVLQDARSRRDNAENEHLHGVLQNVPEAELLLRLPRITPEHRVREFDRIVALLDSQESTTSHDSKQLLLFLAGYLSTVAAGGAPSLTLAESTAHRWPEITAWAYVIGSIGEHVVWTSSFDGLGRLVARELMRPFRLDDPPICDFALEEAQALVDRQLADPLVYLKIKQLRHATVSLMPGVNVPVSLGDIGDEIRKLDRTDSKLSEVRARGFSDDVLVDLADALWPHLKYRLSQTDSEGNTARKSGRVKSQKRFGSQTKFQLDR